MFTLNVGVRVKPTAFFLFFLEKELKCQLLKL